MAETATNGPLDFTTFHNIINNELSSTSTTRHSINPANSTPNPEVPVASHEDVDRAVKCARDAFKTWSKTSFAERRNALSAYANALDANADAFAKTLTMEQGKPLNQAATEVGMASNWIRAMSEIEIKENVIEEKDDLKIVQRYTPMGVAGAIVPWNFPVLLAMGKIVGAVYTGNAVIIKPSPFTPYCGLKLAELATRFFPPGVIQCLSGDDSLGPMFTDHPGIDKISFTGSIATGKRVMASCAKTLKRVTLELGGNDPAIICDDVDIDAIIPKIGILSYLCSSQICMMIKRLYVHERIYDAFLEKLIAFVKTLKVGDGNEADVFFGPVQNKMQYEKAKALFSSITTENLKAVLGGSIEDSHGYFIHPTIIDNPPESSRVVQEEPFAPILPIMKWSDEDDVLEKANALETGLGASVWSNDFERATRMANQLQAGVVWVNSHFDVSPKVPFGGHKQSGMGVEWGLSGLLAYCNSQTQWLKRGI
ncbi:Aldehyde dehydrogenase N-terminal [Penicillium maclennaniae]|uniref:Aldehyde dehydrogenase N-terminal n=1 Tax=Penicillium maclennaniae TaxID=1343394 RepID=UPI0025400D8A|nr:Aldehyde dehydrogenase N-terminal [Penicillium maclennaniae]KAJ5667701.1 Aldehyde dehydrogenase N-terminal [Penicillium maclennaniae]